MPELKERQIRLVHELMYQIKVREVMNKNVVCFPPTSNFREIQRVMKEKRFSGAPIVSDRRIIGIISIDDIITALDKGYADQPVEGYMTRNIVTIPQNYSVIAATNLFKKFRYGRLPVVDTPQSLNLVGILTYGDILSHLLFVVNTIAEKFEAKEKTSLGGVKGTGNTYHFELEHDNFDLAGVASTTVKKNLKEYGIPPNILRRIAVICYEAEINVIIHSMGGYMEVQVFDDRVRILVVDEGPGIPDLEKAMQPGFTTANEKIRALGFGAGLGLSNMKRCADEFNIKSSMETGTEIEAVVFLNESTENGNGEKTSQGEPAKTEVNR